MDPDLPPPSSTSPRTAWRLATLLAVALGIATRFDLGDRPIDYDSANYALVATRMVEWGEHYLDRFNNKPPAIYAWYALVFRVFGNNPLACHLTSVIPDLGVLLGISILARRLAGEGTGYAAAALYGTLPAAVRLAGFGYTETPLTALTVAAALVTCPRDTDDHPAARSLSAGVLMGLAMLFKQPAVLLALGLAVWIGARRPPAERIRVLAAFSIGVGVVVGGLLAWLASRQLLDRFTERVIWEGASRGYTGGFALGERAREWVRHALAPTPVAFPLAIVALLSPRARRTRLLARLLALPILLMALVSYELYDHYLIPALPFLCLVLAEWLVNLRASWFRATWVALIGVTHAVGLWVWVTALPPRGSSIDPWIGAWRARDLTLAYQLRVADFVQRYVPSGEPILSTGSEIPYLAKRENGYRFLGVAPYLGRVDATGFQDFPRAAGRVRVLVLERWRLRLLPREWVGALDSPGGEWIRVGELEHPEFVVYVRRGVGPTERNS